MFFWNKKKKLKEQEAKIDTQKKDNVKNQDKKIEGEKKKAKAKTSSKKVDNKNQTVKTTSIKTSTKKEEVNKENVNNALYRVVYDKNNREWKIKRDGAKRVIDSKTTKEEALKRVKELSESKNVNYVVHKKDGKFQKK